MALCLIPVVVTFAFVILLPLTLRILSTPLLAGRLVKWGWSPRTVFALSLACLTLGVAWLAVVLEPGIGLGALAGPLILLGIGLGLNFGLVDGAVLTVVAPEATGTAAGFLNTLRLGSEAVVIAAVGSALVNLVQNWLNDGLDKFPAYKGDPAELANSVNSGDLAGPLEKLPEKVQPSFFDFVSEGFTGAWQAVLWASAVICALLSVAIYVMLSEKKKDVTVAKGGPAVTPDRSEATADGYVNR
ncbi:hypothetical protein AB0O76_01800 [Streptomyces sp. NPDC086554]|uniref:hypothetical protein n=1 Tax=Streptomyces sp. NPDC086554 TaxID=3154864 RepID=UPI00342D3074